MKLRYFYQNGYSPQKVRVEFWRGDAYFRPSMHLHWNWRGKSHWFVLFFPPI